MEFANWVRTELRRNEWNDADLARRMGISSGTLSNYLSGKRRPGPRVCDLLADALRVDLDLVLDMVGHRPLAASAPPPDEVGKIVSMLRRIRPTRDRILGIEGMLRMYLEMDRASGDAPDEDETPEDATERSRFADTFGRYLRESGDPAAAAHQAVYEVYLNEG